MRFPAPLAAMLLFSATIILSAGCATDSDDSDKGESGRGPRGRGRMSRPTASQNGPQSPELWKQYDLNGDGKITPAEFAAVRATCFLRYDANGDRMLTREEVKRVSPPQLADRLDETFSRLDLDGDGLISREEFDRESDRLFRQWDTNGDGVLAGSELSNLIAASSGGMCVDRAGRPLHAPGPNR